MSSEDWMKCFGIPVVVRYGPLPEHVSILIPKQEPFLPLDATPSLEPRVEPDMGPTHHRTRSQDEC